MLSGPLCGTVKAYSDVQTIAGFGRCNHNYSTAAAHRRPLGRHVDTMKIFLGRLLLTVLILAQAGCASYNSVSVEDRHEISEAQKIYKIETTSGEFIDFDSDPLGYAIIQPDGIARFMEDGSIRIIPLSSVKTIFTKETNLASIAGSAILIGAVVATVLVLLVAHGLSTAHF